MGPMFPRLHVNDTGKGGPRAPPRNKMALYEQLSVPSQRFKHVISSNSKNANCQQGYGRERDVFFSAQLPPSRHHAEKPHSCSSNSITPLLPVESIKKTEEDDFRVPLFIKSKVGNGKFYSTLDGRKLPPFTAVLSGHPKKDLNEQNSKQLAVSREHSCNSTSIPSMDKLDDFLKKADIQLQYEQRDDPDNTSGIFCKIDLLRPECRVDSQVGGTMLSEPVRVVDNELERLGSSLQLEMLENEKHAREILNGLTDHIVFILLYTVGELIIQKSDKVGCWSGLFIMIVGMVLAINVVERMKGVVNDLNKRKPLFIQQINKIGPWEKRKIAKASEGEENACTLYGEY